ncbi:hypothetical protein EST38_g6828 [Candolleomyces aberdarensis]|uniref:F-box domain-containing protein n=1 Tax=Candolleomyces aberdarensis TaxID=2316362 RepID=A0A4Q2DGP3_9AGAR|nr:hypothetical protein EST38_g6828 [Candolleomyces aberdarensis]
MSILQDFWCTDELALHTFASLPAADLRNCAQVSRSFNRIAVQSILDQHKIWNAQRSAVFELANNPNDLDGLSALLLSVHIKSMANVHFDLMKVVSLPSAVKTFHKMQRFVDRMASLHTVYVSWPSGAYQDRPVSDKMLVNAYKRVQEFLDTIISKGCIELKFGHFNVFASKYKLKKNPAITAAEIPGAPAAGRGSIWESAREYLPFRHTRAAPDVLSPLSEEGNYCRKSSRFSISAPWMSLTPSPKLSQVTKVTTFCTYSTSVFRPPFSQWTFALLQASPVTWMTLSIQDIPDDGVESKLILDRLAEAIPDVTTLHLNGARPGLMKDVVAWLRRFQQLQVLKIEPECFPAGTDIDDLELEALARLPHISKLLSSSYFLCAYLASCRSVGGKSLPGRLKEVIMKHKWTSSTRSAVLAFIKDVERLHNAILEAYPEPELRDLTLHILLCFDRFSDRAEALGRIWDRLDSRILQPNDSDAQKPSIEAPPYFRPTKSQPLLCLELLIPTATVDGIQRGAVDEEAIAFCRMFPTLRELMLCSPAAVVSPSPALPLRKERLDKIKSVCPELSYGWVY